MTCPPLETLGNQSMSEAIKLLVLSFHLVILRVEYYRLLNLLNVLFLQYILAHTQRCNAKIRFKSISNQDTARLANLAIE